jgi:glycosyltransferase involved in cell wall biosynthesis
VGIRLVVVDDNPHVRWQGRIYPVNATFHRFLAGLLDVPGAPVASIVHCVPLRDAETAPATLPIDERFEVVGTVPFDGIEGYLRHAPALLRANRPILRAAIADAHLVMIKVPASNAALAAALAARARVARFGWVAGSARAVAGARWAGARGVIAAAIGVAYDVGGRAAMIGGYRVVVGADLVRSDGKPGVGIVASLVEPDEIRALRGDTWPATTDVVRVAWAGRVVRGKGLEALIDTTGRLASWNRPGRIELDVLGDGPARIALETAAGSRLETSTIRWHGYVADRRAYLDILGSADVFVFPSPAEGFPKVILDAMAAGLPVLAHPAGELAPVVDAGVVGTIGSIDAASIEAALTRLVQAPQTARGLERAGRLFVTAHTRQAEADRLVGRLRQRWPALPWAR